MQKRAQVSVEVLFSVGVLALLFAAMSAYALLENNSARDARRQIAQFDDCTRLAAAISGASFNPGTRVNVTVSRPFRIGANARVIFVEDELSCRIPTRAVSSGNFSEGVISIVSLANGSVEVANE